MDEMIEDTMDMMDDEDIEEEADEEVENVLFQITDGTCHSLLMVMMLISYDFKIGLLGQAGPVGPALEKPEVQVEEESEEEEPELDMMQKRLQVKIAIEEKGKRDRRYKEKGEDDRLCVEECHSQLIDSHLYRL